ncbi:hypothetical protein vseg_010331 [Gypsophila vaccaria]
MNTIKIPKLPLIILTVITTTTTTVLLLLTTLKPGPIPNPNPNPAQIKIRPGYTTYESYINHQLNKTLNPKLRHLWTTTDWSRKVSVFQSFFSALRTDGLLSNNSNSLCIGARVGQEVAALRALGVSHSLGIDLVPRPPLVIHGDFHAHPFPDSSFDFEFSNVFDHALYPRKFVAEIERTLRPRGVCVLHVAVGARRRTDKYSANDLESVDGLVGLFRVCEVVRVREIDGFGLNVEVVLRKKLA